MPAKIHKQNDVRNRRSKAAVIDDPELAAEPRDAEKAREDAFLSVHEWNGKELKPFSSGRESLLCQLRAAAGAPPRRATLDDPDTFFPDAIRILWLCAHDPADWRHLRADYPLWAETIEEWADRNIPMRDKGKAIRTAMRILTDSYANRHEPVSSTPRRHGSPGN